MSTFVGVTGFGNNKTYQGGALASMARAVAYSTNNIIIRHSCVVLRRQCQVHDNAVQKHLLPHTLIPIIFKLTAKDGFFTLWKGTLGSCVLYGFSWISELIIAEVFGLPKSFVPDGSSEKFWRHIILKASNFFFCTPLIVTNFIQTVQRWDTRDKDESNWYDVLKLGFERFRQDFSGIRGRGAFALRHSILWLALPTSIYHTTHFLICQYAYGKALNWTRAYVSRKMPSERKRYHTIMPELFSTMTACFVADLICYPLETVLYRLFIKGTSTFVDNLDNGIEGFIPTYKFDGIADCFTSIIRNEGVKGLYSGIGAVLLQYSLQFGFSLFVYWTMERISSAGYTSGPMRVKTATELIKVKLLDQPSTSAAAGCFTPFKSSYRYPQNPSAQFAANSTTQQTSAPILMSDQQQHDPTNGINNQDNPFFLAAIRRQRSTGGSMENNFAGNPNNDNPWGDDK